jgi:hypothetical protein
MTERYGTAIRVYMMVVFRDTDLAMGGDTLEGENLTHLDDIKLPWRHAEPFAQFERCRSWADAQNLRRCGGAAVRRRGG